jgi:ribosomal protein L37AE/L43A
LRKKQSYKKTSTIDLMRITSSDQLEQLHPIIKCKKCGKEQWQRSATPLTWTCFGCGNYVYIELGRPVQQIEVLLRSGRGADFEETGRGTIVPRTDTWEQGQKQEHRCLEKIRA